MEPFVQPLHCHRNTVTDRYKDGDQSDALSPLRARVATIQENQESGCWSQHSSKNSNTNGSIVFMQQQILLLPCRTQELTRDDSRTNAVHIHISIYTFYT